VDIKNTYPKAPVLTNVASLGTIATRKAEYMVTKNLFSGYVSTQGNSGVATPLEPVVYVESNRDNAVDAPSTFALHPVASTKNSNKVSKLTLASVFDHKKRNATSSPPAQDNRIHQHHRMKVD